MSTTSIARKDPEDQFFDNMELPEGFKKAVGVVQVAMGKLGLAHRKIYNIAIANAYEGLGRGELTFRIPVATIVECGEFETHNYKAIYDVFEDLRATPVRRINFDNGSKKRRRRSVGGSGLIGEFDIIEGGVIEYSFTKEMAKVLYQPEEYIWLTLAVQNRFSSKYELSLWENCFRYVGVGSTGFKTVEEWRAILGAEDEYYNSFKHLNQKVLKPAVSGVNEKSGILLEPEFRREKRRVAEIRFDVRENPQLSLLEHNEHKRIREMQAFKDARELGLLDVQAIYWIETRGDAYMADAVAYVRKQKDVKSSRNYLINALNQGYAEQSPEDRKRAEEAEKALQARKAAEVASQQMEARIKQLVGDHFEAQKAEGKRLFEERSEAEQKAFLAGLHEVSNLLSLKGYRERWRVINNDLGQCDPAERVDALLLSEVYRCAFDKWGDQERLSLAQYCSDNSVDQSVIVQLEKEARL